jgi:hypothetical protein
MPLTSRGTCSDLPAPLVRGRPMGGTAVAVGCGSARTSPAPRSRLEWRMAPRAPLPDGPEVARTPDRPHGIVDHATIIHINDGLCNIRVGGGVERTCRTASHCLAGPDRLRRRSGRVASTHSTSGLHPDSTSTPAHGGPIWSPPLCCLVAVLFAVLFMCCSCVELCCSCVELCCSACCRCAVAGCGQHRYTAHFRPPVLPLVITWPPTWSGRPWCPSRTAPRSMPATGSSVRSPASPSCRTRPSAP